MCSHVDPSCDDDTNTPLRCLQPNAHATTAQPHSTASNTNSNKHAPTRSNVSDTRARMPASSRSSPPPKGISSTGSNNSLTRSPRTRPATSTRSVDSPPLVGRAKSGAEPSVLSRNTAPRTTLLTRANRSAPVRPNPSSEWSGNKPSTPSRSMPTNSATRALPSDEANNSTTASNTRSDSEGCR